MWGEKSPYSLQIGVSTDVATVEVSVGIPKEAKKKINIWPSYAILG